MLLLRPPFSNVLAGAVPALLAAGGALCAAAVPWCAWGGVWAVRGVRAVIRAISGVRPAAETLRVAILLPLSLTAPAADNPAVRLLFAAGGALRATVVPRYAWGARGGVRAMVPAIPGVQAAAGVPRAASLMPLPPPVPACNNPAARPLFAAWAALCVVIVA